MIDTKTTRSALVTLSAAKLAQPAALLRSRPNVTGRSDDPPLPSPASEGPASTEINDLSSPEWSGPIGTGLFGTAYSVGGGRSLVLVGSPVGGVGGLPDRPWPWIIMKGRVRDFAFEETLRTNKELAAATSMQMLDEDRLFTAIEKDLGKVIRIIQDAAWAGVPGRPDQRAAM